MSARERILRRVREANRERAAAEHPGALGAAAEAPAPARGDAADRVEGRVRAFAERLEASGGEVVVLGGIDDATAWVREFAGAFRHAAISPSVDPALRPPVAAAPPHQADLGVSRAVVAAAQTGSLVLGSREGRRLQILPPVHLVWVRASEVRATLGEALEEVRSELPAVVALHSGPSKSADIGRIVVTGVHGPGRLVAAVLMDDGVRR